MLPSKLAIVDIETTGLRSMYDRIIDIAIIRIENGEICETLNTLVNPDIYIPNEIEILTGIHTQELQKAPRFFDISEKVESLLHDAIFVAHNARFDYSFIKAELQRLGKKFTTKQLCTARLFRQLKPKIKHNLDTLIQTYNIKISTRHRAFPDAKVLWDFLQIIENKIPSDKLKNALDHAMHRPSLPMHIPTENINNLPDSPGVYHFMGENGASLYIGKSKNIKQRVLSHFSDSLASSKELKLLENVRHIDTTQTSGELSALLLESKLIKNYQPLYNRLLRNTYKLIVAKFHIVDRSYTKINLETLSNLHSEDIHEYAGVFRSVKQAKSYLTKTAREYSLCPKLLGIENGNGACFWYGLNWCKGACINKESIAIYNIRCIEAFQKTRLKTWPFTGPIVIKESFEDTTEAIVVDKWCVLGAAKWNCVDENTQENYQHTLTPIIEANINYSEKIKNSEYYFDIDTYKILRRYILNYNNKHNITVIKHKHESIQI